MKSLSEIILGPYGCNDFIKTSYIRDNIAKLESESVKVYGKFDKDKSITLSSWDQWTDGEKVKGFDDTHSALLICIEPIAKPVTKEEIIHLLRTNDNLTSKKLSDMADRIASHGIGV